MDKIINAISNVVDSDNPHEIVVCDLQTMIRLFRKGNHKEMLRFAELAAIPEHKLTESQLEEYSALEFVSYD